MFTFAKIDSINSDIIGLKQGRPKNGAAFNVLEDATEEYLTKLLALQREIASKYEPRLIEANNLPEERDWHDQHRTITQSLADLFYN